jgi:hypothetical protein
VALEDMMTVVFDRTQGWGDAERDRVQGLLVRADSAGEFFAILKSVAPYMNVGDCQVAEPHKPLRLVLEDDGLKACCNHETKHCTVVFAKRGS